MKYKYSMLNTIQYTKIHTTIPYSRIHSTMQYTSYYTEYKYSHLFLYSYKLNIHYTYGYYPIYYSHPKNKVYSKPIPKHKDHTKYGSKIQYIPHSKYKPHLKHTPYSQIKLHPKSRNHPKHKFSLHKYTYLPITMKRNSVRTTQNLNTNPKPKSKAPHKYNIHPQLYSKHIYLPKHKTHLKATPQTNSHQKPCSYPKYNSPIYNYTYHSTTTKKINIHTTRKLKPNPKPKPKTHLKHNTKSKPHSMHNHHTLSKPQLNQNTLPHNTMASAYRPHHNEKPKYQKKNYLTPNKITNHPPTNTSTHTYLTQLEKTTLILPNHITTNVTTITPKICTRINPIIHNKIRYISQYTPHHIKYNYNPLQKHRTQHPTPEPHPKQRIHSKPISQLKHKAHQKFDSHLKYICHINPPSNLRPNPQPKSNYQPQYKHYPKSITYLAFNPYPKPKVGLKYKTLLEPHKRCNPYEHTPHPQNNTHPNNMKTHKYTTRKNNTRNLHTSPKPETYSKYNIHPQPHSKNKYHTNNIPQQLQYILSHTKTASAYRPRHKEKANCQKLESLTFYTKINQIPKNKSPHIHLSQLEITTLTTPNSHNTTKATLIIQKFYNKLTNTPHSKVCYKLQYTYNLLKHYTHPNICIIQPPIPKEKVLLQFRTQPQA